MTVVDYLRELPELLTLKQASTALSCHPNTLRSWDKQGILRAIRFGARGDRRYKKADILAFIEKNHADSEESTYASSQNSAKTPISTDSSISEVLSSDQSSHLSIPLFTSTVPAGFPSSADDFIDNKLDLNEMVIKHPAATFFVKARGESMINSGINSDDILVVDRSVEPHDDTIIIAILNGELTVKRIQKKGKNLLLMPANPDYKPIKVTPEMDFEVWGTVTHVIHQTK